jgi:radical SAM family RiPP maturation amino acid epimerase
MSGGIKRMSLAHAKRFFERLVADPHFQKALEQDPYRTCEKYGIEVDPYALKPLWEKEPTKPLDDERDLSNYPLLAELREFHRSFSYEAFFDRARSAKDSRYRSWRERQVARCRSQLAEPISKNIAHLTASFELSKGCSGGCWFCAFDPEPLRAVFEYSTENRKLWRDILETVQDILGPAAGASMCYWATEPLDNPDYERFCLDFFDILGVFPPITTAKAAEDATRTRRLMDLNRRRHGRFPVFSVASLKDLDVIHKAFSAEELLHTLLALHNRESRAYFTLSGRAMRGARKKLSREVNFYEGATTACVSGFLLNMVEKSVKLITPCIPDEKWPLGYRTYGVTAFSAARDLKSIILDMMETYMPVRLRETDTVKFRSDLTYRETEDGFEVSTPFKVHVFRNHPYIKELGEIIHRGDRTASDILSLFQFFSAPKENVLDSLELIFREGLLCEESVTR